MNENGAPQERLVVKHNGEILLAIYDNGFVFGPGTIDRPIVQAILVEALAMVTPFLDMVRTQTAPQPTEHALQEGAVALVGLGEQPIPAPVRTQRATLRLVSDDPDQSV